MSDATVEPPADHILQQRLAGGDREALAGLYDRYAGLLHGLAAGLGGSARLAEDAVQDVFLAVAQDPGPLAAAANPAGWLVRATRNRAIDLLRRTQVRRSAADPTDLPLIAHPADNGGPDPAAVVAALALLPLAQREVVVLHVWQGLSFSAIGALLGVSADTIASRWRYAAARLRLTLAEEIRHGR